MAEKTLADFETTNLVMFSLPTILQVQSVSTIWIMRNLRPFTMLDFMPPFQESIHSHTAAQRNSCFFHLGGWNPVGCAEMFARVQGRTIVLIGVKGENQKTRRPEKGGKPLYYKKSTDKGKSRWIRVLAGRGEQRSPTHNAMYWGLPCRNTTCLVKSARRSLDLTPAFVIGVWF